MDFCCSTHHKNLFVSFVDSVVIDHAYDGHTQVAADAKGNAESQARQDGNDVTPWQAEAGTINHWQFLLLHQLGTAVRRQLNGFSIGLLLFNQPEKDT